MNVLHTISSLDTASGGPSTCTYDLLKHLQETGEKVRVVTKKTMGEDLGKDEPWAIFLDDDSYSPLEISSNLCNYLNEVKADIIHTNGLWLYCNHISAKISRKKNIPYVLTPHGMLIENALKRHYWKKWLLLKIWFKQDIMHATCIHATCKAEMKSIRTFGYNGPIAVIPNPMPPLPQEWVNSIVENHTSKRIGFLGRLHPVKNVDTIIKAWKRLGEKVSDAELVIIGSGVPSYEQYLKKLASECQYGKITFYGFLNGREKFQMLANLSALCLVSAFENFGMTVTEALSVGTPVIANTTTPWEDLNEYKCGWWIDATVENVACAIESALSLFDKDRIAMSENGKKLVLEKYSANKVADMMANLYEWILKRTRKPEYVYTIN